MGQAVMRPSSREAVCSGFLLFAEYEVNGPAAADVDGGLAEVREQLLILAPNVLQRVTQYRDKREVPALVHLARQ